VFDADEALRLANSADLGLGANVWTEEAAEHECFIRDFGPGMVTVNGATTTYAELPFGGVKRSGYGGELGVPGLRECCNVQSVWIGRSGSNSIARSE
jgi:succinate-semialdehyde dehydrogenase/glutarate-semialdehyde dehydrogenase